MIERVERRAIFQQPVRGFARSPCCVVNSDLDFVRFEGAADDRLIRVLTARILNFAPAKFDLALDADSRAFSRSASVGFGILFSTDPARCRATCPSVRRFFVLQNFAAEWIRRFSCHSGNF